MLSNEVLRRLYDLTIDNLNVHCYADAIFFADKLVSLSSEHIGAVYLLGECYFRNGDYKKVHTLFQSYKLLNRNISFQLLAARALLSNKQYDQCLAVLELQLEHSYVNRKMDGLKASIAAQCHEAQENKNRAVELYTEAVMKDPTNVEGFSRLVDCQLITTVQKEQLIQGLTFNSEDQWLRKIFSAKIKTVEDVQTQPPEEEVRRDNIF